MNEICAKTESAIAVVQLSMTTIDLDFAISQAAELPLDQLVQFCLNAHKLRHAALAATGRRDDPELDKALERTWQEHFQVAPFCYSVEIVGGYKAGRSRAPQFDEEELAELADLL